MKRRDLSKEELDAVIEMKQRGSSWLKIQKEKGIPRRAVKRGYEEWLQKQSVDYLKAARLSVAEEEFKLHLDYLSKLAESLVSHLMVPPLPNITENGNQFLDRLWESNIIRESRSEDVCASIDKLETQRTKRRNELLFKSLKEHTRARVDWDVLDQWINARGNCRISLESLRKDAREVVGNILNQESGLLTTIKKESKEGDAFNRIVEAVLSAIWRNIIDGKLSKDHRLVQSRSVGESTSKVTFVEFDDWIVLSFSNTDLANKVENICNWAINNLCRGYEENSVKVVANCIYQMTGAAGYFEEALDFLMLRPLILNTRCELCPVW